MIYATLTLTHDELQIISDALAEAAASSWIAYRHAAESCGASQCKTAKLEEEAIAYDRAGELIASAMGRIEVVS